MNIIRTMNFLLEIHKNLFEKSLLRFENRIDSLCGISFFQSTSFQDIFLYFSHFTYGCRVCRFFFSPPKTKSRTFLSTIVAKSRLRIYGEPKQNQRICISTAERSLSFFLWKTLFYVLHIKHNT